jgi:hypothetical protein
MMELSVRGIVEKAFELARSGQMKSVTNLKQRLRIEGFTAGEIGGIGPALTRQLAATVKDALGKDADTKSYPPGVRRTGKADSSHQPVLASGPDARPQSDLLSTQSRDSVQARS